MTSMETRALENAGRTAMVWSDDQIGQVHYASVLKALAPALLILIIAAGLLVAML